MGYFAVLDLPLVTFWSFNRQVDRLRAEGEQRMLRVQASAQSEVGVKELGDLLQREIGHPVVFEKKFDAANFAKLAEKFGKHVQGGTHTE